MRVQGGYKRRDIAYEAVREAIPRAPVVRWGEDRRSDRYCPHAHEPTSATSPHRCRAGLNPQLSTEQPPPEYMPGCAEHDTTGRRYDPAVLSASRVRSDAAIRFFLPPHRRVPFAFSTNFGRKRFSFHEQIVQFRFDFSASLVGDHYLSGSRLPSPSALRP